MKARLAICRNPRPVRVLNVWNICQKAPICQARPQLRGRDIGLDLVPWKRYTPCSAESLIIRLYGGRPWSLASACWSPCCS